MRRTIRHITIPLLVLACPLGLAFLMASARPIVAEPVAVTPLPPVEETDGRAGVCYSYYPDPLTGSGRPFAQKALDAGSRWDRFDFAWPSIEPGRDTWNFGPYDTLVGDLHDAGIENIVGILQMTPQWAATQCTRGISLMDVQVSNHYPWAPRMTSPAASVLSPHLAPQDTWEDWWVKTPPQGLYEEWDDWTTDDGDPINYWGHFVYHVVDHYSDLGVMHWEMWNEPEWSYFWCGTSTDYTQLLKVGYQATKAACPDCTVLFGGLHYWINPKYYRWVLNQINQDPTAPQNNYFFDVMSVHLYSRSSSIYDEVENIRSGMGVYNVADHPIWLTETGVPVWGDPYGWVPDIPKYDYAATQDEAAAYVIQSYANAWASKVERYFFFRANDDWCDKNQDGDCNDEGIDGGMTELFGLVRDDHSLRPAYVAYQVATTYLISPTFVTRVPDGDNMRVTLWGTPRGKVSVLWNESPVTGVYTLTAALPAATLVDRRGVTETITATGDVYTFTLPGATASLVSNPNDYIIGGDPLIVVETETPNEPPTSTIHPLPTVTYSPTFTVTWEGQDNQSGIWLYDLQVRDGITGTWTNWLTNTTVLSAIFTGQHGHTYYFRARATDRVGNREDWPEEPQAQTTLDLSSTFHLSVGAFFADENCNGEWDTPITATGEITLTQVVLHFQDEAGLDVVSPTVGGGWEFTATIYAGQTYRLWAESADHMRVLSFAWPRGGEVYTCTYEALGLWPIERGYLPLILRG